MMIELLAYGLVSLAALAVDVGALLLLSEGLRIHYLAAATIAFVAGAVVNYTLSRRFVFRPADTATTAQFAGFLLIGLFSLSLTLPIMSVIVEVLGLDYRLAKLMAVAVSFTSNYLLRRLLFQRRQQLSPAAAGSSRRALRLRPAPEGRSP